MSIVNLLCEVPEKLPEELFETICESDNVRIERIVSTGHSSPPGFWYDQEEHEWILLLRGEARLVFVAKKNSATEEVVHLRAGDCYNIPARLRHRVGWTSNSEPTVWLAVFYRDGLERL